MESACITRPHKVIQWIIMIFHSLVEGGVLTDCNIHTQDAEETLDFDFTGANVEGKIIMYAECLREAFAELDMSSDVLEIQMSPVAPYFRLTTFGYAGTAQVQLQTTWNGDSYQVEILLISPSFQIDYPKDSDMMEVFECPKTLINRYTS